MYLHDLFLHRHIFRSLRLILVRGAPTYVSAFRGLAGLTELRGELTHDVEVISLYLVLAQLFLPDDQWQFKLLVYV